MFYSKCRKLCVHRVGGSRRTRPGMTPGPASPVGRDHWRAHRGRLLRVRLRVPGHYHPPGPGGDRVRLHHPRGRVVSLHRQALCRCAAARDRPQARPRPACRHPAIGAGAVHPGPPGLRRPRAHRGDRALPPADAGGARASRSRREPRRPRYPRDVGDGPALRLCDGRHRPCRPWRRLSLSRLRRSGSRT